MLTPVDVNNKVFKGGIGYDKKDVETFMLELSNDFGDLYRSNVELKDKVTTLNESLQHYRSIEDSMQKALTLSEKTAEETVNAANDKARQINTEAEMKAEALLADARAELQETKDTIYRLKEQYATYKEQFMKILSAQKKLMEGEMENIDLGANFTPSYIVTNGYNNDSSLGGGLGGLGGGTYVGSSGDEGRERTNQEPAFDRGSLNMDPFSDAANGGGRFSKQTGKGYVNSKKNSNENTSAGLNVKPATTQKTKRNPVAQNVTQATPTPNATPKQPKPAQAVTPKPQPTAAQKPVQPTVTQKPVQPTVTQKPVQPAANTAQAVNTAQPTANTATQQVNATKTVSREEVLEALKVAQAAEAVNEQVTGEVEERINESRMLDSEDNYSEGFDFVTEGAEEEQVTGEVEDKVNESRMLDSEDNYSEGFDFVAEETTTQFSYEPTDTLEEDTYSGEVEDRVNESNMLDSEDNYSDGFDFVVDEDLTVEEIPTIIPSTTAPSNDMDDDVLSGDVEDNIKQSNLIGNADDEEEGFNFL